MEEGNRRSTVDLVIDGDVETKDPSSSNRCSIIVGLVILFLAIATIAFMVATFVFASRESSSTSKPNDQCLTENCIQSAASYLSSMNNTVAPCDDFYEFACGGFVDKHRVPADGSRYAIFTDLFYELLAQLKDLLERAPRDDEPKSFQQARNFYTSCIDTVSINSLGSTPLLELLDTVGGWPILGNNSGGNWDPEAFEFEMLWSTLTGQYSIDGIIATYIQPDAKNTVQNIISFGQALFVVPGYEHHQVKHGPQVMSLIRNDPPPEEQVRKLLLSDDFSEARKAYIEYIVAIVVTLGGNETTALEDATEVLKFGIEIEKFKVPKSTKWGDPETEYNPTTLAELGRLYPEIRWARFLELLFPASVTPPIDMNERLINRVPAYFENMTVWFATQDPRVITNYMVWQLVASMVPYLGQPAMESRLKYMKVAQQSNSVAVESTRKDICVSETNYVMSFITGRMYVDEHYPTTTNKMVSEMVTNLQASFKRIIEKNVWLQEVDKTEAIKKVNKINIKVGFPEYFSQNEVLDNKYKDLYINKSEFFNNTLNYNNWANQVILSAFRMPVSKDEWLIGPAEINAFYVYAQNSIYILAGILQPPFFDKDKPLFSNYGYIGTVIGHEISHGFDDSGREYDKDGNYITWWTQPSIDEFIERSQCIVDQYSDFVMPENNQNLNGNMTLGENIADIGGLKESFKAFQDSNIPQQPMLPALDLTDEQMFFLSFAQTWCNVIGPEGVERAIKYGVHSPGRYRVIGSLQNNEEFAKAYSCPVGSYMNPSEKCNVW